MSRLPLEGMHVVEFGQIVAGPTAGLILADMGADVIKVEPPDAGTPSRRGSQRNGSFFYFNRNKRGVAVNIAMPEGHEIALRLIGRADILIGRLPPLPYESNAYSFSVRRHAPAKPGQHTGEVLLELGYTAGEVESLVSKGIVRDPGLPGKDVSGRHS